MKFEIRDQFYLDGSPFQIISGAIHYFRVVPACWRDRLEKLLAMGCNTVETYIPWNLHEPKKGAFCFEGMADVEGFIRLAQEVGLYVIVRPSPYICAEWELGGLPAWLLAEEGMRLRVSYPPFLAHVADYYRELLPRLAPLQIHRGGPVILMQLENEYGSYGTDRGYLAWLRDQLRAGGVSVPLITSDGASEECLAGGRWRAFGPPATSAPRPGSASRSWRSSTAAGPCCVRSSGSAGSTPGAAMGTSPPLRRRPPRSWTGFWPGAA